MITAKEAQAIAIKVVTDNELKYIEQLVTKAVEKGEFSIRISELSTPTVRALEDLGYKTEYYPKVDSFNECWKISW